ncbi:MAG: hypothetical protein K6A75_07175 [Ruminococcus sp.]|nr:hypothetical protein [Ruminococcus sp.]
MKKIKKNVLIFAITLFLSGCGVDETPSNNQITTSETITVEETAKDIEFSLVEINYSVYSDPVIFEQRDSIKSCYILDLENLNSNIIKPDKEYSKDYFNDNALIFISVVFANTASEPPIIKEIEYNGNTISISTQRGFAALEAWEWWCCFLEVSKSDFPEADTETVIDVIADEQINLNTTKKSDLEVGLETTKPAEIAGTGYNNGIVVVSFTNFMTDSSINAESLFLVAEDEVTAIPYDIIPVKEDDNNTEYSRTYVLKPKEDVELKYATVNVNSSAISCAGVPCDSFKPHPLRLLTDEEISAFNLSQFDNKSDNCF